MGQDTTPSVAQTGRYNTTMPIENAQRVGNDVVVMVYCHGAKVLRRALATFSSCQSRPSWSVASTEARSRRRVRNVGTKLEPQMRPFQQNLDRYQAFHRHSARH
jgi:hypothetical protein